MKTYTIDRDRVTYIPALDVLYIGYGDASLDYYDEIVDLDRGITVMRSNGEFSGAEIHDFAYYFGKLPVHITVNDACPFVLDIPSI